MSLSHLAIQNMAIIESLQLDFQGNMTVLTGETGAGKSIIIDAISLLIGDRASTDLIRHQEDTAMVEGIFEIADHQPLVEYLKSYDIPVDTQLIIKRTIKRSGSGQIRVNGQLITGNQLKEIGRMLVDIHVQHDNQRLFQPEYNYRLLDSLAVSHVIKEKNQRYQGARKNYFTARKKHFDFQQKSIDIKKQWDLMLFQKEEIEKAKLKAGELEDLEARRQVVANVDKLHLSYNHILDHINCDGGALERLYEVLNATQDLVAIDQSLTGATEQINDIYYGLEEYATLISTHLNQLSYHPEELAEIDARLSELQQLKRKYRMEIDEILSYYEQIVTELAQFDDETGYEETLLANVKLAHDELVEAGEALNDERKLIGTQISARLIEELNDLHLFNAQFDIAFTRRQTEDFLKGDYPDHGIYEIELLLSTNKGEPLKPLHKVASGGELSRVMLGLKTILNHGQLIGSIIFDEIDTGVSGQIAASIGGKMKEIAKQKQVFCITHLPQVASLADYHLHVSKHEKDNRTITEVRYLTEAERIYEIARMLSDKEITESALLNAKQLLGR